MVNVSKQKLDQKTHTQLFSQFTAIFCTADKKQCGELFEALFSDAEKTMFIKRVAMVLLISENYSTYAISETLKVSDSTVRIIQTQFENGKFDALIKVVRKKKFDKEEFWKTVDVLLRCGLPPRGRGRWKWLYEMTDSEYENKSGHKRNSSKAR